MMEFFVCTIILGIFLGAGKIEGSEENQRLPCFPHTIVRKYIKIADLKVKVKLFQNSRLYRRFYIPVSNNFSSCGLRMSTGSIISGKDAVPNSWPWQVLISIVRNEKYFFCGGTLISNQWVVTAAHCIPYNTERIIVFLGLHDKYKHGLHSKRIRPAVSDVHVHPKYSPRPIGETPDIALVKFPKPTELNHYIYPACIPETGENLPKNCVTLGWGKNVDPESPQDARILQELSLHVDRCYENPTFYCAWSSKHVKSGICNGDSGGPLLCERNGAYFVSGIVSNALDNCDQRMNLSPGLYTNVSDNIQWIRQVMQNRN